jgi:L-fuculose-phosphate aldolase
MRAVLLARACQVQLQAMAAGEIRVWSDSAEIALKKADVWPESQISAGYAYLCREAG